MFLLHVLKIGIKIPYCYSYNEDKMNCSVQLRWNILEDNLSLLDCTLNKIVGVVQRVLYESVPRERRAICRSNIRINFINLTSSGLNRCIYTYSSDSVVSD